MRKQATPLAFARATSSAADSRTCPTLPGAEPSALVWRVWIESTTTAAGRVSPISSATLSATVSATTSTPASAMPRRSARSRTCSGDSSPATQRTGRPWRASAPQAWRASVDFPMPGSPPTSTTEPATSPPPSTRSSSARPVERRSAAPAVTVASGRGFSPRAARARGSGSASSTIVLHAPQPGHCPSQRGAAWPHCWQTKAERRALSTMRALQVDKGGRTRHDRRVRVLDAELAALEDAGLRRRLRPLASASDAEVVLDGRQVLLLSSNNYLGLATHPAVKAAACAAIERWGCGTGASRLIAGHLELRSEVEAKLAALKGTEAALLFPSGYQANVGAITTLVGRGDHVFSDALNHASIVDGCRLSRASVHVYPHRDVQTLEAELAATARGGRRLIVTDSVFSMDGDRAPLEALAALAEHYHSWLMVDEAHATGVLGPGGAGLAAAEGVGARVTVHMGTLGKALGAAGAYVAGARALVELLVNRARAG